MSNSTRVFSSSASFEKAFPEVQSIELSVKELQMPGWKKARNIYSMNNSTKISEYISCTNPLCNGGGFSLGNVIQKVVLLKETDISEGEHCGSTESGGRPCLHFFKIEGKIQYK